MEKFRRETLLEKSFYHLTEDEIRRMREVVERLAQKIKNILSIRRSGVSSGAKLDLHQTLRKKHEHTAACPFELVFKQRRKKDRPKLVILCDVSRRPSRTSRASCCSSCLFSLQEAFTKIRVLCLRGGARRGDAALSGRT